MSVSYGDPIFNPVFITHLLPYLTPIDYLMLRRAAISFFRNTDKRYPSVAALCLQRCAWAFRHVFELPQSVCDALIGHIAANHLAFTGGALLSLLQGDRIDPVKQDIDLASRGNGRFGNDFDNRADKLLGPASGAVRHTEYDYGLTYGDSAWWSVDVHGYTFQDNVSRIHHIHLRAEGYPLEPFHQLPKSSDLSVCGNLLCGQRLLLRDANGVLARRCQIDPGFPIYQIGLSFANNTTEFKKGLKRMFVERLTSRIAKYQTRGYQIDEKPGWREDLNRAHESSFRRYFYDYQRAQDIAEAARVLGRGIRTDEEFASFYEEAETLSKERIRLVWGELWDEYRKGKLETPR
jgi:hypothetical protein